MSDAVKPDTNEAEVVRAAEMLEAYDFDVTAALLRDLLAERNAAVTARDDAIRRLGDAARDAGRWRGISEGNDVVIKHLSAERDALRAERDKLRDGISKALLEIEDAGPKALKYAAQELRAALAQPEPPHD